MNVVDCIKTRRSVRNFKNLDISKDIIESIIDDCRFSPTWKNSQTPRYTVVQDKSTLEKIANECVSGFTKNELTIKGCAALVVLSYVSGISGYNNDGSFTTSKEDRWEMFDAGIATQTFSLAAHNKGIGSVILGIFDDYKVAKVISLPKDQKVATLIAIGYPDKDKTKDIPKRKEVSELLRFI